LLLLEGIQGDPHPKDRFFRTLVHKAHRRLPPIPSVPVAPKTLKWAPPSHLDQDNIAAIADFICPRTAP